MADDQKYYELSGEPPMANPKPQAEKEPTKPEIIDPDIKQNRWYAALSYVWVLSIVLIILKSDSKFVKFHAKQGIVMAVLLTFFWWIPLLGQFMVVALIILEIIGFGKAKKGLYWQAPVVYKITKKVGL